MSGKNPLKGLQEPAAMLGGAEREGKRSAAARRWDAEHRPTSYRLAPWVPDHVRVVVAWYKAQGLVVTQGQAVEDLLRFALEAWKRGEVEINVRESRPSLRAVRRE